MESKVKWKQPKVNWKQPIESYVSLDELPNRVTITGENRRSIDDVIAWAATRPSYYEKPKYGVFGWVFSDDMASIFRYSSGTDWVFAFRYEKDAIEFKLLFG